MGFPDIEFYNNYMFISTVSMQETCFIYNIFNPELPDLICEIDNSGVIALDEENELLFMGYNECEIYDLSDIEYGIVNQIGSFRNWSNCVEIIPFQRNDENYLLYLEDTSCSIYQYDYEPNQTSNDLIYISPYISNQPNPFNPSTEISFQLSDICAQQSVDLTIYNIKGQKVKQLVSSQLSAGQHSIIWDGTDVNNRPVSSGIYFYQLEVDGKPVDSRKCLLLK